jgi:predicted PurR-regulated permease PerM
MSAASQNVKVNNTVDVVSFLRRNSAHSRILGHVFIGASLVVGGAILVLFLIFTQVSAEQGQDRIKELYSFKTDQQKIVLNSIFSIIDQLQKALPSVAQGSTEEQKQAQKSIADTIDSLNFIARQSAPQTNDSTSGNLAEEIISGITSSVIRIGAVLVGIFLIQIMVEILLSSVGSSFYLRGSYRAKWRKYFRN